MEETISLQEIFDIVKKRFKLIIFMTIGAAIIAAGVSYFLMTPIYQSSGQFIVNQNDAESNRVDSSTIRTNVELIKTYENIISSDAILNDVIEELNLPYSASKLDDKIQISNDQGSQVVTLTVKEIGRAPSELQSRGHLV